MTGYVSPLPTIVDLDYTQRIAGQPQKRRMHLFPQADGRDARCGEHCRECYREQHWTAGQTRGAA